MKQKRLLVYCANLHVGGGVSVATSVLAEIAKQKELAPGITVCASTEVHLNLLKLDTNLDAFREFIILDRYGIHAFWKRLPFSLTKFDAVLTLFGPAYFLRKPRKHVVGFAQPWILYPKNDIYDQLSLPRRFQSRMKYWIQEHFYVRSDVLVVEHKYIKQILEKKKNFGRTRIEVINSTADKIYYDRQAWEPISINRNVSSIALGVIAANYPHKNLRILPKVKYLLKTQHGIDVEIFVTLSAKEWEDCDQNIRASLQNVGRLTLSQCPTFIEEMDALVFPTLLECFSSVPLEAKAMGKEIFASDRPFIRETVQSYPHYFNPLDPSDIAQVISNGLRSRPIAATQKTADQLVNNSTLRAIELLRLLEV